MCANRVGKTFGMGGFETTCHLTGLYPEWWPGRRFGHPVRWWAAGKTNETTRDIVQTALVGQAIKRGTIWSVPGTGLIPGDLIGPLTWKQGNPGLIDTLRVRHVTGGMSILGVKSYQQGRGAFEGTELEGIWLDEESPMDIYGECAIRTATTNGLLYTTFTPLEGLSDMALGFMPAEMRPTAT